MTNQEKLRRIMADPILWIETFVNIADKKGRIVPFKLNPQQKYILRNKGKFNITLKARQLGITSCSLAYSLYLAITKPNTTCMIMSYSEKGVNEIFEKLRIMYTYLPSCIALPTLKDNRSEIKFANNSRIINCTCGSKDNARGSTLTFAHLSEVAFMNENVEKQLTAIEQALVSDGCMILESTANGLNHFSEMWNKAVSGETPLWKPFFFSWVQDKKMFADEYQDYKKMYKNIYGAYLTENELDEKEIALKIQGASMEQLMWRRLKISSRGEEAFCQEFPSNPIEAFISTGSGIFNASIIQERLNNVHSTPILKLPVSGIDPIIKKYSKYLTLWKLPVRGQRYMIGVDSGEGLGGGNDYSYVGDTAGVKQYFSDDPIYTVLDEQSGYLKVRWHKATSGVTGFFKKSDVKAYKTGGLVDYTGLAQLDGTPGKPELVLNAQDTDNFLELRDALRAISQRELTFVGQSMEADMYGIDISPQFRGITDIYHKLNEISTSTFERSPTATFGDIVIDIDHVENYNDFVRQLQKDKQFENMIQSMTIGRLGKNGCSSLAKYKFTW